MRLSRRGLLLGASSLLLPLLPESVVRGQESPAPKRFVVFHTPNGLCQPGWYPGSSGFLGPILDPLADHASRLLLIDGLDMTSCDADPVFAANHPELYTHNLTGANMVIKEGSSYQMFWGGGPSVDQKIARHLIEQDPSLPFESFTFAIDPQGVHSSQSRISYTEEGTTVPLIAEPLDAFQQLFATADLGTEELQRLLAERRSMLDFVLGGELERLRTSVAAEDRIKIDKHLEGLNALEKKLAAQAACTVPDPTLYGSDPDFVRKGKLHMDMLAMALACGLTRVANIQWGYGTIQMSYPWVGALDGHHQLQHGQPEGSTPEYRTAESITIGRWYATMFKHLLDRLSEVPEGDGTMLDNTLVLWTSEHGSQPTNSDGHDYQRMPFLLAGNLGGMFQMGRRLVVGGRPHNDLFVSLCQAYGMESMTTFGNPDVCTGPLTGL